MENNSPPNLIEQHSGVGARSVPKCPYCGKDLLINTVGIGIQTFVGKADAFVFSCGAEDCRKTINIQIINVQQPKVIQPDILNLRRM